MNFFPASTSTGTRVYLLVMVFLYTPFTYAVIAAVPAASEVNAAIAVTALTICWRLVRGYTHIDTTRAHYDTLLYRSFKP